MFRWTPEKKETALDMAITGRFSDSEIGRKIDAPRRTVGKFLKENREEIETEAKRTPLADITETSIIDLSEEGQAPEKIAEICGCTVGEVRRVVLLDKEEEWNPADDKAAGVAHLALLRSEHPTRLYEEDIAALTECVGQSLPMRGRTIEAYLP